MDRLTIATQVLLKLIETDKTGFDAEGIAAYSFEIADAMQAEAEKRESKERPDVLKEEWQPDWSQAPDDLVKYFAVDEDGRGGWYINKPDLCFDHWYWSGLGERVASYEDADNFGYQGNWQGSLRERPHGF